jgi:starvation-inducible outer membrane lipoprotein
MALTIDEIAGMNQAAADDLKASMESLITGLVVATHNVNEVMEFEIVSVQFRVKAKAIAGKETEFNEVIGEMPIFNT